MKTAIVKKEDLTVASVYDGPAEQSRYGGPWGRPEEYSHVEWDEAVMGEHVVAEQDAEGVISMAEDVQKRRDMKLSRMRAMRKPKLDEADRMINDLVVGDRTDTAAVQLYRNQLKSITDSYKDTTNENMGTSALDNLEDDLSDFAWPSKP